MRVGVLVGIDVGTPNAETVKRGVNEVEDLPVRTRMPILLAVMRIFVRGRSGDAVALKLRRDERRGLVHAGN